MCAGADAVYMGGSRFGARAFAENPDEKGLLLALDYVHLHGRRLYLTVNTLLKESEMSSLYDFLEPYYRRGLDGVIVQDLGVLAWIREYLPLLPIHASTQMTVTGVYGARLLKQLGVTRVVPAREISLNEAASIRREADIEVECFVHGALCYCYSGQCLLSSMIGGRSGNRGRCAQPCRLPYDVKLDGKQVKDPLGQYVMSLKDLCTVSHIPDLMDAGIDSFKIEGRMKSPRYTAGVVSVYRKYIDLYLKQGRSGWKVDQADIRMLSELFDRGGFTGGYYKKHNGRDMIALKEKPGFRAANQNLFDYLDQTYVEHNKQEPVTGAAALKAGLPCSLELSWNGIKARVQGAVPELAKNQPVTEEKIRRQLMKMGSSSYQYADPKDLHIDLEGDLFIPVQALNELRRAGVEALEQKVLDQYIRKDILKSLAEESNQSFDQQDREAKEPRLHILVQNRSQLEAALEFDTVGRVYLESALWPEADWSRAAKMCHQYGVDCYLAMPVIFRDLAKEYFTRHLSLLRQSGIDGLLVRSLEELAFVREFDFKLPVAADANLYTWNCRAQRLLRDLGAWEQTFPLELNSRELGLLDCREQELVVYGYVPVMTTAQCIRLTSKGCGQKSGVLRLKDRMGKEMMVQTMCRFCYNVIYNPSPLSLLGQRLKIQRLAPKAFRMLLTVETAEETRKVILAFSQELCSAVKEEAQELSLKEFTRGHFSRGVE